MAGAGLRNETGIQRHEEVELAIVEIEWVRVVGGDEPDRVDSGLDAVFDEELMDSCLVGEEL